ncbi:hypothetical protein CDC7B_0394 [Corynebacterium diphtheriae C7 (beta)]|nr:hypothetical protein CDC7B_0394 [Corynebacterium diphtheriae C7 (beta)]
MDTFHSLPCVSELPVQDGSSGNEIAQIVLICEINDGIILDEGVDRIHYGSL